MNIRKRKLNKKICEWWLRSPLDIYEVSVGYVLRDRGVKINICDNDFGIIPVCLI